MRYRIGEAAALLGVPATTLRYYEDIGLVAGLARDPNGYRTYGDDDVARLRFVASAKDLGIPLAEVRELAAAHEVEDCSTVAHQVVEAVARRLTGTQQRIAELTSLAAQLQRASARLAEAPTAGPCGPDCPCLAASLDAAPRTDDERRALPLVPTADGDATAIACSLEAGAMPDRLADWQRALDRAERREPLDGGVTVLFPLDAALASELAGLAAAEHACCPFFDFALRVADGAVRLDVRAPVEAGDVVAGLFGVA
jgi:DNA-binding transcriptional MerR regulator